MLGDDQDAVVDVGDGCRGLRLAGPKDRLCEGPKLVGIQVRLDIGLTIGDLRSQERLPGHSVAQPAAAVVVGCSVPEGADTEVRAGDDRIGAITRSAEGPQRRAFEGGAVPEVLGKRTRVWACVAWKIGDNLSEPFFDGPCQCFELDPGRRPRFVTAELGAVL
jgi:hypothetical protein